MLGGHRRSLASSDYEPYCPVIGQIAAFICAGVGARHGPVYRANTSLVIASADVVTLFASLTRHA